LSVMVEIESPKLLKGLPSNHWGLNVPKINKIANKAVNI
jgi:hypothetical protein